MFKKQDKKKLYGIVGVGRWGMSVARELAKQNEDIIIVDSDETVINEVTEFTGNVHIVKELNKENLAKVGIPDCDIVIIGIGEKLDVSILTTLTVINLGVKRVISKASSEEHGQVLEKIGAEVIFPEREQGKRLANQLIHPDIFETILGSNEVNLADIQLPVGFNSRSILDLNIRKKYKLNIIAIKRNDIVKCDIEPDYILKESDILCVVGKYERIKEFESAINK